MINDISGLLARYFVVFSGHNNASVQREEVDHVGAGDISRYTRGDACC